MADVSTKSLIYKLSGEFKDMRNKLNVIESNQDDMKTKLDGLTNKINDPEEGVVVKTNRNTEFREMCEPERAALISKFQEVLRWKTSIQWVITVAGVAIIGAIVKLIFFA